MLLVHSRVHTLVFVSGSSPRRRGFCHLRTSAAPADSRSETSRRRASPRLSLVWTRSRRPSGRPNPFCGLRGASRAPGAYLEQAEVRCGS